MADDSGLDIGAVTYDPAEWVNGKYVGSQQPAAAPDYHTDDYRDKLHAGILAADKAGDAEAVHQLAAELARVNSDGGIVVTHPQAPLPPAKGMLGSMAEGVANGFTAHLINPVSAAADALIPGIGKLDSPDSQTMWDGHGFSDAYHHNLELLRGQDQSDQQAHPNAAMSGELLGAVASPLAKVGEGIQGAGLLAGAGRVMLPGAVYGAAQGTADSQADTPGGVALDAAKSAAIGAAGNVAGRTIMAAPGAAMRGVDNVGAKALRAAGVDMTPGQILGGAWQNAEQKLTSVPIFGDAIKSRLADSGQGWWKATLNQALEPIGKKIPENIAGQDAVDYGQKQFGAVYDQARAGLRFDRTPQFDQGLTALKDQTVNGGVQSLSETFQRRFDNVLRNTVERRMPTGSLSGDTLKTVTSDLEREAAKYAKGADTDGREYAAAIKQLVGMIDSEAVANPNSNPAAVALMKKANEGYALWAQAENAAKQAGGETGTATPTQYLRAVKQGDRSVRNRAFSAGNAFNQDWAQQGVDTLGKAVPNSFTADRMMMAKLVGGALAGAGADSALSHNGINDHGAGMAAVPLMMLGAGGYSKPVNSMMNSLLLAPRGKVVTAVGQQLNRLTPAIGAAGGSLALQHNVSN